jgi:SpoIID/LytB domain protein
MKLKKNLIFCSIILIFFAVNLESGIFRHHHKKNKTTPSESVIITSDTLKTDGYEAWRNDNYKTAQAIYSYQLTITTDTQKIVDIKKNLATISKQLGEYKTSLDSFTDILKLEKSAKIYSEIGALYYYQNDLNNAEINLKKSLALDPNLLETNFNLGRVYLEKENFNDAITCFQKTIELNNNFSAGYYYLGETFRATGTIVKALENYENSLKKDLYFVEGRIPLLALYLKNKEYENTYKQINRIKCVAPDNDESNKAFEKIRKKIKAQEMSIAKSKKETGFLKFTPTPNRENIPLVKVGLNTNAKGEPNKTNSVVFKSSGDFYFKENNKIIMQGFKNKKYSIILKHKKLTILNNQGMTLKIVQNLKLEQKDEPTNSFIIDKIESGKDTPFYGKSDNQYRGELKVSIHENTLLVVNIVNVEEYCYSVISSETIAWWPIESIKAQAVLIRNHVFFKKETAKSHQKYGYNVCDSQHCQVYKGISTEKPNMNACVDATRAEVLVSSTTGNLVNGLFHSNSGGYTQASSNVKGWASADYLQNVFCGYDGEKEPNSPYEIQQWIKSNPKAFGNDPSLKMSSATFRWFRIIKPEYIEQKIIKLHDKNIGKIQNIIVLKRSQSGHVNKVLIKGTDGEFLLEKENSIRNTLGLGPLRSTLFWIETKHDDSNKIKEFTVYGGGWGHGIGMDQTGGASMASKGYSYENILKFFYKNTEIQKRNY